ncbi:SURF1 family protein [Undibacterium sp.]|uniref:SURF1 family protein n=1 Tax=Undibacterium sp. TaxID=1914977 RepID=UPI00273148BD|nr:SURF1 family protein [Undibacterium sp.]MDP1977378.1 SURF1 family protein [Undibacterium sp.]
MNEHEQGSTGKKTDLTPKTGQPSHRSRLFRLGFTACMAVIFAGFFSLGTWQVLRLQWKLDLIERVEQRVHAAPVPIPGFSVWPNINASADEYRHVQASGVFLHEKTVLTQATTELGGGFWVMTPLAIADGATILINRGYIPEKMAASYWASSGKDRLATSDASSIQVTGLLRMTEPGGGFLRKNDPAGNRWYSRDVNAIATAIGLTKAAPFFIDADAGPDNNKLGTQKNGALANTPVAGLTVIHFHNNHLIYAIVWFLLAAMAAAAWVYVIRHRNNTSTSNEGYTA